MKLVKVLDPYKEGQIIELYKKDDDYIVVSTVEELRQSDVGLNAVVGLVGMLGGYATSGEETMAFPGDETGEIVSWSEIDYRNGPNSRAELLAAMGAE